MVLRGEEGVRFVSEYAVEWAVEKKVADPKVLVVVSTAARLRQLDDVRRTSARA